MLYVVVAVAAIFISGLTFFTGFGLGTLLLPFFLLVFDPQIAVAATAVVHLVNNLFKFTLIGKHVSWRTVAAFGIPAAAAAFAGAMLLDLLAGGAPIAEYPIFGRIAVITPIGLVIGLLIIGFGFFDLLPSLHDIKISRRMLPLGGVLSGFFGGLSGHQGGLRATFLVKAGLGKEGFIATSIACAILVDIVRITVYGLTFISGNFEAVFGGGGGSLLLTATLAAFVGAVIGRYLLHKTTLRFIRIMVGALMLLTGALVTAGII